MAFRTIYGSQFLFVGPSPSTGYHFIDYTGRLNDNYDSLTLNHNLLKPITRVQDVSFSLEDTRTEVRSLGVKSLVDRPEINSPKISFGFSYLLAGLINDARLGLNVNFAQFQYPYSGTPYYSDNYAVNLLSGLVSRDFVQPTGDPYWPYPMRDNRNIFLVRRKNNEDLIKFGGNSLLQPDLYRGVDPLAPQYDVLSFGHCYLDSYQTSAAVNSLPISKVSFSCENAVFYTSGSGCYTPIIDLQARQPLKTKHFNIPAIIDDVELSVLQPGDIALDISGISNSVLTGFALDLKNTYINSYSIQMDFSRDLLTSVGYMCPIDREIVFPVICNLSFNGTVGNFSSGNLIDRVNKDDNYNIDIRLKNPINVPFPIYSPTGLDQHPRNSGPAFGIRDTSIYYAFRNVKFNSVSYSSAIGSNATATLNFSVEVGSDDFSKGLFISGLLGISKIEDVLIEESGNYILDSDNNLISTNLIPLY